MVNVYPAQTGAQKPLREFEKDRPHTQRYFTVAML